MNNELPKICVVTGARSDYGLLYWLMKDLESSPHFKLQIIVSGMHLSPEFGFTVDRIQHDEFEIDRKVEMLMSSDTDVGVTKSIGIGMIGFADAFDSLRPDLVILLGDRFEAYAAASAAFISKIPIAHLHGGEVTEGAYDEALRHSITKMASLHFTSTEVYRKRVIQLGEQPDRVHNVGAIGLDNIQRLRLLNKDELETAINFKFNTKNFLVTFHPPTLNLSEVEDQFSNLLIALSKQKNTNIIFTKANADTRGRSINQMIDRFVERNPNNAISFKSIGQLNYLSALKHVDGVLGNSSSGIIEAPTLKTGTINIGDRQLGRVKADSVIDSEPNIEAIDCAIQKLMSNDFAKLVRNVKNPHEGGDVTKRIIQTLRDSVNDLKIKKSFYDLHFIS